MADAHRLDSVIGTKGAERGADAAIAAVAARQHGVITRAQLLRLGVGPRAITHRLERERLHALHRGVYAVGHTSLTRNGVLIAAVLAAGDGAVLSHRAAAEHWQLRRTRHGLIEVTVPRHRRRPGLRLYQSVLPDDERTLFEGVSITTVARTLLDLAAVLPPAEVERALERAHALRLWEPLSVRALLDRYPRRPGVPVLGRILAEAVRGETITRSELEDRFLSFLAGARLPPPPRVNAWLQIGGRRLEVDFLWPAHRLVAELDGYTTHGTRASFERDRSRDRLLQAAGYRVVRVTWRQLHDDPAGLGADLSALLGCAAA